jgi:hypothetical protein
MIWLEYARQQSGRLVHVDQAIRGKSNLSCPYCGREVLARKGDELSWHFAHAGIPAPWPATRPDSASRSMMIFSWGYPKRK